MSVRRRVHGDDGVSLVLALVFIVLVGLFATVALTKSQTTLLSGVGLRDRGQLQYALDGSVEHAWLTLQTELKDGSPSSCTDTTDSDGTGSIALNGKSAGWTCTTLAGRARSTSDTSTSNYALVVTSPNPGAFTTNNAVNTELKVAGSVYLNGAVTNTDVAKQIQMTTGDLVAPSSRAGCAASLTALTQVTLTGTGQLRRCTEQTVAQAQPTVVLPSPPTWVVPTTLLSGVSIGSCRVFYPGTYTSPPDWNGDSYFVSGLYYFNLGGSGRWDLDGGDTLIGGAPATSESSVTRTGSCASMNDTTAMSNIAVSTLLSNIAGSRFTTGVTFVFGGRSSWDFKNGSALLFTPPVASGSSAPVSIVGARASDTGYAPITTGQGVLTGGSNNTSLRALAKVFAPTGAITLFSTNNTTATAPAGVVAYRLDLQASNSGSGGVVIAAPSAGGNPPPPFRTVRVVSRDSAGGSASTMTAVATLSNYAPYTVDVLSWRTG